MNLKPKNNSAWHEWINRKFVAVYFALALVLVINQIVFAVLLTDREKAKAFDSSADAGYVQSITNLGNQTVVAGATDVTLAEFFIPDSTYFNENVACNGRITGNPCLTMLDSDGAATTTSGPGDDDGYDYAWQLEPDSKMENTHFTNTDKVCVNTEDTAPTCVYIDKTDGTACTDGATADVYILGVGCALGTDIKATNGGRLLHSEKVAANAVYDYCDPALDPGCGTLETETIWYTSAWIDTVAKNHTCNQRYDKIVDCDGTVNTGRGECQVISYGDPLVAMAGTEKLCANSLTNPTCVYIDPDLVIAPLPANCPGISGDELYLKGLGCGAGADLPVGVNWGFNDVDNSGTWSDGEDIYNNVEDPNGNPGTTYNGEIIPGVLQNDPFPAWLGNEGFYDANANGWFDNADIVFIDNDSDNWYTSGIDTDVYSEAVGLVGDGATEAIIYFNTPGGYGENGFNLFLVDVNDPGLDCADTILEDTGNIQGGPGSISAPNGNGVIDTIFEAWNALALKNIGTALANRDVTNVRIYTDAWYSFCWPGPCPPTDGHCTGPSSPEDKFWATMNMNDNLWISNNNYENTQNAYIFARACIVADIPATAINGKTVQIQLPKLKDNNSNGLYNYGDEGFFVYSSNDGLTGSDPYNFPYTYTVSSMNFESVSGPTDSTPAGEVQSLGITADSSGTVTLNWIDPTADDLKEIIVTEISGGIEKENIISKGVQTLVLTGRLINSKYTYKVQSRDVNGLESIGIEREVIVPAAGKVSGGEAGQILPEGVNIGDLLKSSDSARVYYLGDDKKLHWFANETIFRSWYPDFNKVKTVSKENMLFLSVGNDVYLRPGTYLVKKATDSKVYAVEPGGVLRWIKNEQIATSLYGSGWDSKIKDLSDNVIDAYTQGMAIDTVSHPTGSLISYPDKPTVYYIDMGKKRAITNSVFIASRYQNIFVIRNVSLDIKYEDGISMDVISEVGYWQ